MFTICNMHNPNRASLTLAKMCPEPLTQECKYKREVVWVGSNMDLGLPVGPHTSLSALVG